MVLELEQEEISQGFLKEETSAACEAFVIDR